MNKSLGIAALAAIGYAAYSNSGNDATELQVDDAARAFVDWVAENNRGYATQEEF